MTREEINANNRRKNLATNDFLIAQFSPKRIRIVLRLFSKVTVQIVFYKT